MARIRTLKPEYFTSEQIMELRPLTRLTFIGIWPFCDDHGVHTASVKTVKAEIYPSDNMTLEEVSEMIEELITLGLLVEYSANGRSYWHVTGWDKHQKIDKPTYKYPFPYQENQIVTRNSTSIRRIFDERSGTESNGVESNGMEIKPTTAARTENIFVECFEINEQRIKTLYPHADYLAERETCIAHYRTKPPPVDCYPVILKWFQRVHKPKPQQQQKTFEQMKTDNTMNAIRELMEEAHDGTGQAEILLDDRRTGLSIPLRGKQADHRSLQVVSQ